jgi:hypothetical protein
MITNLSSTKSDFQHKLSKLLMRTLSAATCSAVFSLLSKLLKAVFSVVALRVKEHIENISSRLVVNAASFKTKNAQIKTWIDTSKALFGNWIGLVYHMTGYERNGYETPYLT